MTTKKNYFIMPKSRTRKNHRNKVKARNNERINKARKRLIESGMLDQISDEYTREALKDKLKIKKDIEDNNTEINK